MHEHNLCEHELKYCKVCNVVYCEKCNSQWYNYTFNAHANTTWTYLNSPIEYQNPDHTYVYRHDHENTGG